MAESPIRVAQIVGKMMGGGVEAVVMNYYRHINRSRVQFDFLVDADSTLVPREEIESLGGRVFSASCSASSSKKTGGLFTVISTPYLSSRSALPRRPACLCVSLTATAPLARVSS